jgi:hypothetical protein
VLKVVALVGRTNNYSAHVLCYACSLVTCAWIKAQSGKKIMCSITANRYICITTRIADVISAPIKSSAVETSFGTTRRSQKQTKTALVTGSTLAAAV